MKKLLFTAIAVIAFSGVSMAETKEVKFNKIEISVVKKKEKEATPCQNAAINTYEQLIGQGADDWDLLNALLSKC